MNQEEKHEHSNATVSRSPKANEEQAEWQRKVLYHQRMRTHLNNENKYLGWLRVSLGMVMLGFVVERLDLFLASSRGIGPKELPDILLWAPLVIYCMGGVTIFVATWEFFSDRRQIMAEVKRDSRLLFALILLILVFVLIIALILWLSGIPHAL